MNPYVVGGGLVGLLFLFVACGLVGIFTDGEPSKLWRGWSRRKHRPNRRY